MNRNGRVNLGWLAFLASIAVFAMLIAVLVWRPREAGQTHASVMLYCAAGIRLPVERAALEYEKECGIKVQLEFGGSQTLLTNAQISQRGDLYLPADDSYIRLAREKKLIDEVLPLAEMRPVIGVKKGNSKKIQSIADLLRNDVKLAQANPDAAAIGYVTRETLKKTGEWEAIEKHTAVFKPTVNDAANDVKLGTVDAAIVWDVTVKQYPELEAVRAEQFKDVAGRIEVAVLRSTRQPTAALRFARYLAARDRGLKWFKEAGFEPVEGDAWAVRPVLHLLAGAMLRPAIDQTISDFERREGVEVVRVYNGCGILVAQMKAGERPDMYFSCDRSFMKQVADLFIDHQDVSGNRMVILVPKGNPSGIKSLSDLTRPGLKVGLAHEQQSALGALTKIMLDEAGVREGVRRNLAVEVPAGDMLVNQLRAGGLDAAIAYISNAAASKGAVDVVEIDTPAAHAVQPVAVGKDSPYKQMMGRLAEALTSVQSREKFEWLGFEWVGGERVQGSAFGSEAQARRGFRVQEAGLSTRPSEAGR